MRNKNSSPSLEFAILGLLQEEPAHGYALFDRLKDPAGIGQIWHVKRANLYAILEKMEHRGWLESRLVDETNHPPRNEYHLTPDGVRQLDEWLAAPTRHPRDIRQEFLVKVYLAGRTSPKAVHSLLDTQRRECLAWQAQIEAQRGAANEDLPYRSVVLEYRLQQIHSIAAWIDRIPSILFSTKG